MPEDLDKIVTNHYAKRLNYIQKLRDSFRQRFDKEYLANLIHVGKSGKSRDVTVGEVVLIGSENTKRIYWPVERLIQVCAGKDGINKVAKIKTKHRVLVRPVQRLFSLKVSDEFSVENIIEPKQTTVKVSDEVSVENDLELEKTTVEDSIPTKLTTERRSRYGSLLRKPHRY